MRTLRLAGGGRVCLTGGSARGVFAQGEVNTPPAVDRILDTRLWKHYLSATSFADGNKCSASGFNWWACVLLFILPRTK